MLGPAQSSRRLVAAEPGARNDDRVSARVRELIVQLQRRFKYSPADRQHLLTIMVHDCVAIGRLAFQFSLTESGLPVREQGIRWF